MKVKDLVKKLKKVDQDLEVFVRIPTPVGNIAELEKVTQDTYGFFGQSLSCIIPDK
jgi:hypothetical protein